jgi:hypothetical protein
MKPIKIITYILAFVGLLAILFTVSTPYFVDCHSQQLAHIVSHDNRIAKLEIQQCKAQTAPELRLALQDQMSGNYHILNFATASSSDVTLTWTTSKLLTISYPDSMVLTQEPSTLSDVQLRFLQRSTHE